MFNHAFCRSRSVGRSVNPRENYYPAPASGRSSAVRVGRVSPATSLLFYEAGQAASNVSPFYEQPGGSATLPRPASGGRLNKVSSNLSAQMYYSSDGSGGVRSPPPTLVHRSGVPPAQPISKPVARPASTVKVCRPKPQK